MKVLKSSVYGSKMTFFSLFKNVFIAKKKKEIRDLKIKPKEQTDMEEDEEMMTKSQIFERKKEKIIEEFISQIPKNKSTHILIF